MDRVPRPVMRRIGSSQDCSSAASRHTPVISAPLPDGAKPVDDRGGEGVGGTHIGEGEISQIKMNQTHAVGNPPPFSPRVGFGFGRLCWGRNFGADRHLRTAQCSRYVLSTQYENGSWSTFYVIQISLLLLPTHMDASRTQKGTSNRSNHFLHWDACWRRRCVLCMYCIVRCRIQLDPDADVKFSCPVLGLRHDYVGKHLQVKPTKLTRICKETQRQ